MRHLVLVCGGRYYNDAATVESVLAPLASEALVIVHGDARGADTLAERWAERAGVTTWKMPADWRRHGNAAGPIRNQAMLDTKPDLVIAFPGGKGTADMVRRAQAAGVPVKQIQ